MTHTHTQTATADVLPNPRAKSTEIEQNQARTASPCARATPLGNSTRAARVGTCLGPASAYRSPIPCEVVQCACVRECEPAMCVCDAYVRTCKRGAGANAHTPRNAHIIKRYAMHSLTRSQNIGPKRNERTCGAVVGKHGRQDARRGGGV